MQGNRLNQSINANRIEKFVASLGSSKLFAFSAEILKGLRLVKIYFQALVNLAIFFEFHEFIGNFSNFL
jgi:hypothetical protein